ncbi:MAG: TlpA family protein disulfide reductase [Planctomycetia bacterium]|nr:TlpA family protein disulfide reductase [Planctomycetia bacterium]
MSGLCGRRTMLQTLVVMLAGGGRLGSRPPLAADTKKGNSVRVELVDHDSLMAAVAARTGKVVVLDCWSTSCPPCVKEFPRLVALAAAHGDRVACLSLAFDYEGIGTPEESLPRVREFLEEVGAGNVCNMLSREEADVMYRKLDLTSVPAVSIWRPDGSLAVRYDDDFASKTLGRPFTYADIEATVRQLLESQKP